MYKLMINSLYGKMLIKGAKKIRHRNYNDDEQFESALYKYQDIIGEVDYWLN
jgi:hypothetical protein